MADHRVRASADDPTAWADALEPGEDAVPIISLPLPVEDESELRDGRRTWSRWRIPLAHVSLGYATRPATDVADEITAWSRYPVAGVFFDHAPSSTYQIGPVVHAVRTAERLGLATRVLNAGVPVGSTSAALDATVCASRAPGPTRLAWRTRPP